MSTESDRVRIATSLGWVMFPREKWMHKGNPLLTHPTGKHPNKVVATEIPDYFKNYDGAADAICEFMRGKGFTFESMGRKDGTWNAAFWAWRADKEQPERYSAIELANQPAAICAAFCQFIDSEKGDGR